MKNKNHKNERLDNGDKSDNDHDSKAADVTAFALDQLLQPEADAISERLSDSNIDGNELKNEISATTRVAGLVELANSTDLPSNIAGLEQQMEEALAATGGRGSVRASSSSSKEDLFACGKESSDGASPSRSESSDGASPFQKQKSDPQRWSKRRLLAVAATGLAMAGGGYLLSTVDSPREVAENLDHLTGAENQLTDLKATNLPENDYAQDESESSGKTADSRHYSKTVLNNDVAETELRLEEDTTSRGTELSRRTAGFRARITEAPVNEVEEALGAVTDDSQSGNASGKGDKNGEQNQQGKLAGEFAARTPRYKTLGARSPGQSQPGSVPDGGTVLIGGIKAESYSESKLELGASGVRRLPDDPGMKVPANLDIPFTQGSYGAATPSTPPAGLQLRTREIKMKDGSTATESYYAQVLKTEREDGLAQETFLFDGATSTKSGGGTSLDDILNAIGDEKNVASGTEVQPVLDALNSLEVRETRLALTMGRVPGKRELKVHMLNAVEFNRQLFRAERELGEAKDGTWSARSLARKVATLKEQRDSHFDAARDIGIEKQVVGLFEQLSAISVKSPTFYYTDLNDRDPSSNEQYELPPENQFQQPTGDLARSTFAIDVDTASYANARRFINSRQLPPANAVRVEEFINYFNYDYAQPTDSKPFAVNMEVAGCPWNESHKLLRVGIKGKEIAQDDRPASNLVFLIDVSGSMSSQDKLPLLQRSMLMLVDKLTENDKVTIVTYAGNAGLRMEPTSGDQKEKIRSIIQGLSSGGSTHGSAGIRMAYDLASKNLIAEGTNRVILATDGDLNVGVTADDELVQLITEKADLGVFLSVLGFGTGNLKDAKLEKLADNGNGQYSYIDSIREARKVLIEDISGCLITIAKDVKLQVEFNPALIAGYRLIGYENRALQNQDFDNDLVDAGEIGAGHTVTALYELVPVGAEDAEVNQDNQDAPLKYQRSSKAEGSEVSSEAVAENSKDEFELTEAAKSDELLTLALRFKEPMENVSTRVDFVVTDNKVPFDEASNDFRFAASVASYGMLLRHSRHAGTWKLGEVENAAATALGDDSKGHRAEFIDLVRQTKTIVGY